MSTVLILTVVVLVGVAIWQMGKIFEISQLGAKSKVHSGVANDEDNKYNGLLIFLFLVFIALTVHDWISLMMDFLRLNHETLTSGLSSPYAHAYSLFPSGKSRALRCFFEILLFAMRTKTPRETTRYFFCLFLFPFFVGS